MTIQFRTSTVGLLAIVFAGCQAPTSSHEVAKPPPAVDDARAPEALPPPPPIEAVDPAAIVPVTISGGALEGPFDMPPALVRTADEGPPEVVVDTELRGSVHDSQSVQQASAEAGTEPPRVNLLAAGDTPSPITTWFTGTTEATRINIGGINADTQIASSRTHICLTARDAIACYTKGGRLVLGPMSGEAFFASTGLPFAGFVVFDMRAVFDQIRNRFVIAGIYKAAAGASAQSQFVVAMSKSTDPRAGWNQYAVPATGNPNFRFWHGLDYPYLGVGGSAIVIAGTMEVNGPHCTTVPPPVTPNPCVQWSNLYTVVHLLGANAMASGSSLSSANNTYWQFWEWSNSAGGMITGGLAPVVSETSTSREYLLNRVGSNQVDVWAVNNPFTTSQSVTRRTVTLAGFTAPVDGRQSPNLAATPRLVFTSLGTDVLNGQFRNNEIVFTTNDARNWDGAGTRSSVRLVELDVAQFATATPIVRKDRAFGARAAGETPYSDYGFAAVAQNLNGDVAIASMRTNSTIFPQSRLNAWLAADTDIRPSILMAAGSTPLLGFGGNAGFDTGGVSVDPFDDVGIYFAQPFPSTLSGAGTCGSCTSPASCNLTPNGTQCPCNNFRIAVSKMFGVTRADLNYTSISSSSANPARGANVTITLRVENDGDISAAAFNGRIYLSTNETISTGDTQIGSFSTTSLGTTTSRVITVTATIPAGLAVGTYFLGAQLDSGAVIAEYLETNNTNPPALTLPRVTVR